MNHPKTIEYEGGIGKLVEDGASDLEKDCLQLAYMCPLYEILGYCEHRRF